MFAIFAVLLFLEFPFVITVRAFVCVALIRFVGDVDEVAYEHLSVEFDVVW